MIDTSNPIVLVGVGAPGSGKSTWWSEGLKNGLIPRQSTRINMDEIRLHLTGSESDQSQNNTVAKLAEEQLKSNLSNKTPVIFWDNTSAKRKYRKSIIDLAKMSNYKIIAIYWDIPLQTCLERNKSRARMVPEDVILKMYNSIKEIPPTKNEGFDDIIVINN
jgi:predicted kinase